MRELQIGGNWTCRQCGQYCSGAVMHDCPEDKKQSQIHDFVKEHQIEVTCPRCKKKRMIPVRNTPFFGDITICSDCNKNSTIFTMKPDED